MSLFLILLTTPWPAHVSWATFEPTLGTRIVRLTRARSADAYGTSLPVRQLRGLQRFFGEPRRYELASHASGAPLHDYEVIAPRDLEASRDEFWKLDRHDSSLLTSGVDTSDLHLRSFGIDPESLMLTTFRPGWAPGPDRKPRPVITQSDVALPGAGPATWKGSRTRAWSRRSPTSSSCPSRGCSWRATAR